MRLLILAATSGLATGHAVAQGSSWDGTYFGVSAGVGGLSPDSGVSIALEPAGRPDANYTGITYIPSNPTFEGEISSESKAGFAAFVGMTFAQGDLVWGGEARAEIAPIERDFAVGTVRFFPVGPFGTGPTFPLPQGASVPPGGATRIYEERETISSSLQIDYSLAARGRLGVPLGDDLLLSGIAGISIAQAQLDTTQSSEQLGAYFYRINIPIMPVASIPFNAASVYSASAEETLVGVTVGALAEYNLTDNWIARADVTYTRYGEISITNGPGTSVSFEPSTWATSLGVAYRF